MLELRGRGRGRRRGHVSRGYVFTLVFIQNFTRHVLVRHALRRALVTDILWLSITFFSNTLGQNDLDSLDNAVLELLDFAQELSFYVRPESLDVYDCDQKKQNRKGRVEPPSPFVAFLARSAGIACNLFSHSSCCA